VLAKVNDEKDHLSEVAVLSYMPTSAPFGIFHGKVLGKLKGNVLGTVLELLH
jgi:hypothetical protein